MIESIFEDQTKEYNYSQLLYDLESAKDETLLKLLKFNGRLSFISNEHLPHSQSPENMLKFVAIQILIQRTQFKYEKEIKEAAKDNEHFLAVSNACWR